jgi:hypothetical protein
MYTSSGVIMPPKLNQKYGWYHLSVCTDLAKYYQSLSKTYWALPLNGPHITFISGEKDERFVTTNEMLLYIGQEIQFEYDNVVWTNGKAFWLTAYSPQLLAIRAVFKLPPPRLGFHITLGNIKNATTI